MFRSKLIVSALSFVPAVCFMAASQAVLVPSASASVLHGAPLAGHMSLGGKTVKLSLNNATGQTVNIMVGTQAVTIDAGKTVQVSAAAGTNITFTSDTATHKTGDVLVQVSKDLGGSTLHIG